MNLELSASRLFACLLAIETLFLVTDSFIYNFGQTLPRDLLRLLSLTREGNIPTWFASLQALLVGTSAYFIGLMHKRCCDLDGSASWRALGWFIIAAFFLYVSFDDAAQFHERMGTIIGSYAKQHAATAGYLTIVKQFDSYYWQIIFMPFFTGLALFMLIFLSAQLRYDASLLLFVAGIGCYGLAVTMDYLDGIEAYDFLIQQTALPYRVIEHQSRALEEFIEMLGTSLILIAFIRHWNKLRLQQQQLEFQRGV